MARPSTLHEGTAPRPARWKAAVASGTAVLLATFGLTALPAAAQAATARPASPTAGPGAHALAGTGADASALRTAFAKGRHIPSSAVGGIRPGSLRLAEDTAGDEWAVADFVPTASAGMQDRIGFQDGAAKAVFEHTARLGTWTLVQSAQSVSCGAGAGLPSSVGSLLGLTSAACDAADQAQPSAAAKSAARQAAAARSADLGPSIANLALTQVGLATTPAETSFNGIDCDPFTTLDAAFSPNSDGCGPDATHSVENQNEEWCSDFAKWAYAQAGVTADLNTLNAGANSWYQWALDNGQTPAADAGTPEPGDAVVFYPPGALSASTFADHVGLITSVNSDGTVDMANGDFLGSDGITVEYNQNLDLTTWASSVWNQGEQWVLVTPPTAAQSPAPSAAILGPSTATAGTSVNFSALANEAGGSISQYYWTFNDGRNNNQTAQNVSHVFQRAGFYSVTMTATSNLGTVKTVTWNIGVGAPSSSSVSSVPNNSVWYTTDPVMQYTFTAPAAGGLAVDSWDGASWLQQTEPGSPAPGSAISSLTYSDGATGYATVPHAFYRTGTGTIGETYLGDNGWTNATLPGSPGATSAVAALASDPATGVKPTSDVTPSVFFFDASGALHDEAETGSTWSSSVVQGPLTSAPGSLAVAQSAGSVAAENVFYLDNAGNLIAATNLGGSWTTRPVPNSLGVRVGTPISAATTQSGIDVFFIDAKGQLAVATAPTTGAWKTKALPGSPAAGSTLTATNDLSSAGAVDDEVFYLTASGAPAVTASSGSGSSETWQATTMPGTATALDGASPDTIPGMPQQLFLADGTQLGVDTSSAPGAAWSHSALPSTPTAYPGTVLLYAATAADDSTALAAASYAGLPASQVTTSFADAWGATLSGNYLVIAIGQAAVNALYDNPCGWANPSQDDPGSTPFANVDRALNLTLTNLYIDGAAATTSQTPQRADDLAYFAVHGALPAGATLPAVSYPGYTCLGTAS